MPKLDTKKQLQALYQPIQEPHFVNVPPLRHAMIDGRGAPGCADFQRGVEALFTVSYGAKFALKKRGTDYAVMPLEGLWWADDMSAFLAGERDRWHWTLMIHQPAFVPQEVLEQARTAAAEKVGETAAAVRFEELHEGRCAQSLHFGPFSEEGPTIARLHSLIAAAGGTFAGQNQKHHEIYLSDFRRTVPEKLKTILRQPFLAMASA